MIWLCGHNLLILHCLLFSRFVTHRQSFRCLSFYFPRPSRTMLNSSFCWPGYACVGGYHAHSLLLSPKYRTSMNKRIRIGRHGGHLIACSGSRFRVVKLPLVQTYIMSNHNISTTFSSFFYTSHNNNNNGSSNSEACTVCPPLLSPFL
jgi:hypothetical protein